jgi:hypothetical protein
MRNAMTRILLSLSAVLAVSFAQAQDAPPVPKMFKDLQGQKGQYKVEILEGGGRMGKGSSITVCSNNLIKDAGGGRARPESGCKYQLIKDTDDEAVVESECKERKSTVTMKREGKSMLMDISTSKGAGAPQIIRMRTTHLGACREGQGAVSIDKNKK